MRCGDQMACQVKWFVGIYKATAEAAASNRVPFSCSLFLPPGSGVSFYEKLLITNRISNERRSLDKYLLIISLFSFASLVHS